MGKRKPTPRTVEKRLFEETHHEYIIYREFCIYTPFAAPLLAHGRRLGDALKQIRDDPKIVNDKDFLFSATQLLEEGERKRENALWRTQMRMIKEGYEIQGDKE